MNYLHELEAKISVVSTVITTINCGRYHLINNNDRIFVDHWLHFIHELKKHKYHSSN